jgi:sec-independent protein translocase protein TatB
MFGIGLPEMLLIMALALIVVGPDKLPDLARSLAKGLMDLKKTAESLKGSFAEQDNPLNEIRPELEEAAKSLKNNLLDLPPSESGTPTLLDQVIPPADKAAEAYQELMKHTSGPPPGAQSATAAPSVVNDEAPPLKQSESDAKPTEPTKNEH